MKYFKLYLAIYACFFSYQSYSSDQDQKKLIEIERVSKSNSDCLECHQNEKIQEYVASTNKGVYIPSESFKLSAHGGLKCLDCHEGFETAPHLKKIDRDAVCAKSCHTPKGDVNAPDFKDRIQEWEHSIHGIDIKLGKLSDRCEICHSAEEIKSFDPNRRPPLCGRQPSCSDCHDVHAFKKPNKENGLFDEKKAIVAACATCHITAAKQFSESVHFANLKDQEKAPACNDCHSEHQVIKTEDESAKTSVKNVVKLCTDCHASLPVKKASEFSQKFVSYDKNFHGRIYKSGAYEMANCASCHGYHNILPSDNPKSSVHKDNLAKTCGQSNCHAGLKTGFEVESFHKEEPATYITNTFMTWLIILTVGGWIIFIGLDIYRHHQIEKQNRLRRKALGLTKEQEEALLKPKKSVAPVKRFDFFLRFQHFVMMIGVLLCLITGMPIRFAYLDSIAQFFQLTDGIVLARWLHKLGGVMLYVAAICHLYYIVFTKAGRRTFIQLIPLPRDFVDFWKTLLFYVGKRPHMPPFAKFSYIEKFDYWAAYWGMTIFLTTGAILTMFEKNANFVPEQWGDIVLRISVVVHSQEALLESLALIMWHLYWTHLNRKHFPANMVIFTGTAKFDHYYHEYRDHLAELKKLGELTPCQVERFDELEKERNTHPH